MVHSEFRSRSLGRWLLVIAAAAPLVAHDMWIEPATFYPQSGEIDSIRLRVGQELLGDPLPRVSSLINQFVVVDKDGRKPVVGREGGNPAGFVRPAAPGMLVVGYYSKPSEVELDAEKFNQYLKDEGLDAITSLRASRKQTNAKAHELFSRCAKSLILAGSPAELGADRNLGFVLELVAEKNPYTLRSGEELPVRLTYENRPLANALVVAMNRLNPSEKLKVRTDKDGRARLRLTAANGMWFIKAVHMVPAPAGSNADWSSFWASLTFEPRSAASASN